MHYLIQSLTLLRLFAGPIIFWLLLYTNQYGLTLFLFSVACASDYFDGFFARKYNVVSEFGKFLDPVADKICLMFVLIYLIEIYHISIAIRRIL